MELAKLGQKYHKRLHMEDASANTSASHSIEPMSVKERGGVNIQDRFDKYKDEFLGQFWEDEDQQHEVLSFPECKHDAVTVTSHDIESLQPGVFLSGNIIDFYIKYLQKKHTKDKDRLHFFNTSFFTKLVKQGGASTEFEQRKYAFEIVQKWSRGVKIFEKEYIFIPVHQSSHWSLIILCHLSSLTSSSDKHKCLPCILHLDPAEGKRGNLEDHIRRYIIHSWMDSYHNPSVEQLLALSQMKYGEVEVPRQENHYDSGIYLLHFIELFLRELQGVGFVPNGGSLFTALWSASEVSAKRRDIRDLILEFILASKRRFREYQRQHSQLYQLIQIWEANEQGREDPHNSIPNAGVDESEHANHQTTGDVALSSQQRTEVEHVGHRTTGDLNVSDDQQRQGQLESATLKPGKERRKRCRNWSQDETSILLTCMKEGGRFSKGNQASTDWIAISLEIAIQLSTSPTADQCRLRYDTLLKAYKKSNHYCMKMGKQFSELHQGELKLATHLTEDWYSAIDEICQRLPHIERSRKRLKYTLSVDDLTLKSSRNSPPHSPLMPEECSSVTTAVDPSVSRSLYIGHDYLYNLYMEVKSSEHTTLIEPGLPSYIFV